MKNRLEIVGIINTLNLVLENFTPGRECSCEETTEERYTCFFHRNERSLLYAVSALEVLVHIETKGEE